MVLLLIVFAPVVFFVARWSWRFQRRVLLVAGTGLARVAGRPGIAVLLSIDADAPATIARLRRWEAGAVPVVMWRDRTGVRVELSQTRTGQHVALSVIPQPVALVAAVATPVEPS